MKYQKIYNRIRRIEGQVRGIGEMLNKDRPEEEVLIQLEAAKSSLASTISSLLESMLIKDESGNTVIKEKDLTFLLRSIKNSK